MTLRQQVLRTLVVLMVFYFVICLFVFFIQEQMIFVPQKLPASYKYKFQENFEEVWVETDHVRLNGLHFKADSARGLIFYLHGNAGALDSWGTLAPTYLDMNFDVFFLDYRGYGKSEGSIESENQFLQDIQLAYNQLKQKYDERRIVVLGYSIGTGPAAWLASQNKPGLLVLQAPYYSLTDLKNSQFPYFPDFILKYKFETNRFLQNVDSQVLIFHGTNDKVINYNSSERLKAFLKPDDHLVALEGLGHEGYTKNIQYRQMLEAYLESR